MEHDRLDAALSRLYQKTDAPESFETGWRAAVRREESIRMTNQPNQKNIFTKRLVPVLAALVLVVGGLWAGTQDLNGATEYGSAPMVASSRSASKMMAEEPTEETQPEKEKERSISGVWFGLFLITGTLSLILIGALIFRPRRY